MDRRQWIDSLFREHADSLYRYLRTFRLPEDETHDLVQSVFMKLITNNPKKLKNPKAWLFAVGRNMAINQYHKQRRTVNTESEPDPVDTSPDTLTNLLKDEQNNLFWTAFKQLSKDEQELLRLRLNHEQSHQDIALIVGKSPGAVRVALHRIKEQLITLIEQTKQAEQSKQTIKEAVL